MGNLWQYRTMIKLYKFFFGLSEFCKKIFQTGELFLFIYLLTFSVSAFSQLNWGIIQSGTTVATTPPAAAFAQSGVSLDGSTEYLLNNTAQSIGIGNAWTIDWWGSGTMANAVPFTTYISNVDLTDYISVQTTAANKLNVQIWMGTLKKSYVGNTTLASGSGWHVTTAWDGTSLELFVNGTAETLTKTTDLAATMTTSNRKIAVGKNEGSYITPAGTYSRVAIWNKLLGTGSIAAIDDAGQGYKLDLRNASGAYSGTDLLALVHQWAICKNSADVGADYSGTGGTIDIDTDAANITSADCVPYPS